jgi:hypothetical protein
MELITPQMRASHAAEAWESLYKRKMYPEQQGDWGPRDTYALVKESSEPIYDRLVTLGENPTPEQVNEVIGNNEWTVVHCTECDRDVESAVTFFVNFDSGCDAVICNECLAKAFAMVST